MTNKEKFLNSNIGFHFEDLSLIRQAELQNIMELLGVSQDWIKLALSKDSLDNWEKWGFNLFKKAEFRTEIDNLLAALNKLDDSKFKAENAKNSKKKKQLNVSEATFKRVYEAVMKQGMLYEPTAAVATGRDKYWGYGHALTSEGKEWINTFLALRKYWTDVEEEDRIKFVLSVQYYETMINTKEDK